MRGRCLDVSVRWVMVCPGPLSSQDALHPSYLFLPSAWRLYFVHTPVRPYHELINISGDLTTIAVILIGSITTLIVLQKYWCRWHCKCRERLDQFMMTAAEWQIARNVVINKCAQKNAHIIVAIGMVRIDELEE